MSEQNKNSLRTYTSDLLALETHFLNAVKKQKSSEFVKDEIVVELLHELDKTVSKNVTELEKHLETLGGKTKDNINQTCIFRWFSGRIDRQCQKRHCFQNGS